MNPEIFVNYRIFQQQTELQHLTDLLSSNHIEFLTDDNTLTVSPYDREREHEQQFHLKLRKADFSKADELMRTLALADIEQLPADYYLYHFSDEELIEILTKPDEWSVLDYELALKILAAHGHTYDRESLENLKKNRLEFHRKPERSQAGILAAGYLFALAGGLLGMIIGYMIYTHRKTLPNGDRIFAYQEKDRVHAKRLIALGFAIWVTYVIIYLTRIA